MLCAGLVACSTQDKDGVPAEVAGGPKGSVSVLSAADTASGEAISLEDVRLDTLRIRLDPSTAFRHKVLMYSTTDQDTLHAERKEYYTIATSVLRRDSLNRYALKVRFEHMNLAASFSNPVTKQTLMKTEFKSDDSAAGKKPENRRFLTILRTPIEVHVTDRGDLKKILGTEAIAAQIIADQQGGAIVSSPDPAVMNQIRTSIEASIVAPFVSAIFIPFPDSAVKEGLQWTKTQHSDILPTVRATSTQTLKVVGMRLIKGRRVATIEGVTTGSVKSAAGTNEVEAFGSKITNTKLQGSARAIVDLESGITLHHSYEVVTTMRLNFQLPGGKTKHMDQKMVMGFTVDMVP